MSFMEYQVLGYESPLYGRRTAQFKVEPLTYKETAEFNPSLSNEQNALVYGITGGVPHYINKLAVQDDLMKRCSKICLTDRAICLRSRKICLNRNCASLRSIIRSLLRLRKAHPD